MFVAADAAVSTPIISCVLATDTIVKFGPPISTPFKDDLVKIKLPPTVAGTAPILLGIKNTESFAAAPCAAAHCSAGPGRHCSRLC